jgi:hypothetical protein
MAKALTSAIGKTDAVTLFTSKDDFDSWLEGLTIASATTSSEGVVTQGAAVASPSGDSAANNQTAIIALLVSLRNANIIDT